jgi:ribosomal protein S27AE
MPFDGYTSKEVCALLRRSRAGLKGSGLMDALGKSYPFGPRNPLYDRADVEQWQLALQRHDGLVALRRRHPKTPLRHATQIGDAHDATCPKCGGWAMADPEAGDERRRLWCSVCGVVEVGGK